MILEATVPPVNHLGETVCLIVATRFTLRVDQGPLRERDKFPVF